MKPFIVAAALVFLASPALAQTTAPIPETATTASDAPPVKLDMPAAMQETMLTDDTDIHDADQVSGYIDVMANNVRACIRTNQATPDECQCKFPNSLDNLKIAYDKALRLHPEWDGKTVSYKKGTAPSVSVSFAGLKKQMTVCVEKEKAQ